MTIKTCFKCLSEKTLGDFYKHPKMADGHLNKCIECAKKDVAKRAAEKIEHIRKYDRMRSFMPHRIAARKEYSKTASFAASHKASAQRWAAKHPDRRKASQIVSNAIRDGRLKKQPCICCGDLQVEGHHPDYSRPLDVIWLCISHHKQVHKETEGTP